MATNPATITTLTAFLLALQRDRQYRRTYIQNPTTTVNATAMSDDKKTIALTGSEAEINAELANENPARALSADLGIQRYIHF